MLKRYVPALFLVLSLASCGKKQQLPNPGPAHPQGKIKATVAAHSVTLSWTASPSAGVNYHVFREGTAIASPTGTTYTDSGLAASTTFHYQVTSFYNPCTTFPATPCVDSDPVSVTATTPADPVGVSVTVAPTSASVQVGKTQQFTATVTGTTTTAVTWTASTGTVTATGLFTAPGTAGSATVTATSTADATKSASATVTVTSAPPPSGFPAGARVKTLATANVRSTAPPAGFGTLLGTEPAGALGTVTTGTQVVNSGGWTWIQVKFDTCAAAIPACTGYVGSDNLAIVSTPPPPPPPTPSLTLVCTPTANKNTCVVTTTGIAAGTPYTVTATEGGLNAVATGVSK